MIRLVYLHGFASGPGSTKAQFFRAALADRGLELIVPDLAPDFRTMTIAGELAVAEPLVASADDGAILFGSSLGGYLAALVAARQDERVRGLVLFAPAFGFLDRWRQRLGEDGLRAWRAEGSRPVFHHATGREEPLSIALLDDAARYPAAPDARCPALAFAGRRDESVPIADVAAWCAARPQRRLVALDSGHELTDVLAPMWEHTAAFLASRGAFSSVA